MKESSFGEAQRKFAVEFMNNIESLDKKTSHSKKTCRALYAFFTERIEAELAYSQRLATLAKNGIFIIFIQIRRCFCKFWLFLFYC